MTTGKARVASILIVMCIVSSGFAVHADRDIWAYILIGDGDRSGTLERLGVDIPGDYVPSYVELLGWGAAAIDGFFWNAVADWQQGQFIEAGNRFRSALISKWSVPSGQIETHHAWAISSSQFETTLSAFAARNDGDGEDLFIFYYAGHGAKTSLAPLFDGTSTLKVSTLNTYLRAGILETHQTLLVLDACYSGHAASVNLDPSVWLLTSTGNQSTYGLGTLEGGLVFTNDLVDAMGSGRSLEDTFEILAEDHPDAVFSPPEGSTSDFIDVDEEVVRSETLRVSFQRGATTRYRYTGTVTLEISGTGDPIPGDWWAEDAFYSYDIDNESKSHDAPYGLHYSLNRKSCRGQGAESLASGIEGGVPRYSRRHRYTVALDVGRSPTYITFGNADCGTHDNTGYYRIKISGSGPD